MSNQNAITLFGYTSQNNIQNNNCENNSIVFTDLNPNPNDNRTHIKYLSSSKLPYISRSQFKKDNKNINSTKLFETEIDLYNQIFKEDKYHGLIIWGEGGIGKTRLMFELANKAKSEGWLTYYSSSENISFDRFSEKIADKKYCLVIDYIEEKNFDVVDLRNLVIHNSNVKIIANARNKSHDNYKITADTSNFKHFRINLQNRYEDLYIKYVVENILKEKNIFNIPNGLLSKPSFAVFILDILDKHPKDSNISQILIEHNSFSDYINSRLHICFDNITQITPEIYYIFASLPFVKFNDEKLEIICQRLLDDGWIDYNPNNNTYYVLYNDTITDTIIKSHFKSIVTNRVKSQRIAEYFDFGVKYKTLRETINSLERAKLEIPSAIFYEICINNIEKIENYSTYIEQFIKSNLLNEVDKIKLIYDNKDKNEVFQKIVENKFIPILATAMRKLAKNKLKEKYIEQIYKEWSNKNKNLYDNPIGTTAYIIESHILYFGIDDFIIEALNDWQKNIVKNKAYYETSFIIGAILNHKKKDIKSVEIAKTLSNIILTMKDEKSFTHIVKAYFQFLDNKNIKIVVDWINENLGNPSLSFVLQPYLEDKTKNFELVKGIVIKWIKFNAGKTDTSFSMIVSSYFKRGGKIDEVEEILSNWINRYINSEHSSFIVGNYLEYGGNIDTIKNSFIDWINTEEIIANRNISFAIIAYLKRAKDFNNLKPSIIKWINIHGSIQDKDKIISSYVIQEYFKFGGKLKPIKEKVKEWINNNSNLNEKTFAMIVKSYFKARGNLKYIESTLQNWIINSSNEEYASFVIAPYLSFGGNIESKELNSCIIKWIIHFIDKQEASFVIQSYLERQEKLSDYEVKNSIMKWIKKYGQDKFSGRIIVNYLRLTKDLKEIEQITLFWMKNNYEHKDVFKNIVKYYCKSGGTYKKIISVHPYFSFIEKIKILFLYCYIKHHK